MASDITNLTSPENTIKATILKYGFQNHFLDVVEDKKDANLEYSFHQEEDTTVENCSDNLEPKTTKSPQECKICGRILSSIASYYVHMKSHSNNKPYKCTLCEVSFTRKPYLEVHIRTHTGERPFKCTICNKSFTQKSSLNTHLRVHTGDKPFTCEFCNKSFALKSYVIAHRWSHVGEGGNTVSCDLCGECFTSRAQVLSHRQAHTSYSCLLCDRSFSKQSYLNHHIGRSHSTMRLNSSKQTESEQEEPPSSNPTESSCLQVKESMKSLDCCSEVSLSSSLKLKLTPQFINIYSSNKSVDSASKSNLS